jgi:hypothetical protein
MAVNGDEENQTVSNEQTPLLNDEQSDDQADQDTEEPKQVGQARWYIWRVFWVVVAALILAVFIKGWIDAGSDVNVRPTFGFLQAFPIPLANDFVVRLESCTQASPWRRSQWCRGHGFAGLTSNGTYEF